MSAEINNKGLDDLLKKTLADDLPAEVEAGMRRRIAYFRSAKMKDEGRATAWAWLFRRSAWAVLSILMLVAGILLQSLGPHTPLAGRIARVKTEFASGELPRPAGLVSEARTNTLGTRLTRFLNDKEVTP
jgi:hypothetical protein